MEIEYQGHRYRTEGKNIFKDDVLLDTEIPHRIGKITEIKALLVDDIIYFDGDFYF